MAHPDTRGAEVGVRAEGSGAENAAKQTQDRFLPHRRRGANLRQEIAKKEAAVVARAPESTSESEEEDDVVVILEDHTDVIGPSWRAFETHHLKRFEFAAAHHPSDGPKLADFEKLQSLDPVDEKVVTRGRYSGKVKSSSDGKLVSIDCQEIFDRFQRDVFVPPAVTSECQLGAMVTFRVLLVRGQPQACEIRPASLGTSARQAADLSYTDKRQIDELIKETAPVESKLDLGDGLDGSEVAESEVQALQRRMAILNLCNNRIHISPLTHSTKPFTLGAVRAAEKVIRKSLGRIRPSRGSTQTENDHNRLHLKRAVLQLSRTVLQAQLSKHKVARALSDACKAMFSKNMTPQKLQALITRYDEIIVILTKNAQ